MNAPASSRRQNGAGSEAVVLTIEEKEAVQETLTEHLPELRKAVGMSQDELSERVGVTRQTLSSLERGQYKISWKLFMAFLSVFERQYESRRILYGQGIYTRKLEEYLRGSDGQVSRAPAVTFAGGLIPHHAGRGENRQ